MWFNAGCESMSETYDAILEKCCQVHIETQKVLSYTHALKSHGKNVIFVPFFQNEGQQTR